MYNLAMANKEGRPIPEEAKDSIEQQLYTKALTEHPHSKLNAESRKISVDSAAQVVRIPFNDMQGLWTLAYDVQERAFQTREGTKFISGLAEEYTIQWNTERFKELSREDFNRKLLAKVIAQLALIDNKNINDKEKDEIVDLAGLLIIKKD